MQLRKIIKIIKTRGHFPTDDAALKLLYLALRNLSRKWRNVARQWRTVLPHSGDPLQRSLTPATE